MQANRDEVARVRTAWNVLSDPFQRQRYDAQASTPADSVSGDEVEIVDDSDRPEVELTGWRKLMAPPPKAAPAAAGGAARNGGGGEPTRRGAGASPTIPLPPGMRIAEPRAARHGDAVRPRDRARDPLRRPVHRPER